MGVDLLDHVDRPGPFRLVGMVAYTLNDTDDLAHLHLFSTLARQRQLEGAIDELIERFGTDAIHRADYLTKSPGMTLAPTLDFLDDCTPE